MSGARKRSRTAMAGGTDRIGRIGERETSEKQIKKYVPRQGFVASTMADQEENDENKNVYASRSVQK